MKKKTEFLIFPNNNEMLRIPTDALLFVEAEGNYSRLHTIDGRKRELVLQLGEIEKRTENVRGASGQFIRVGRSLILNRDFITYLNVARQSIEISDSRSFCFTLSASKGAIRKLRNYLIEQMDQQFMQNEGDISDDDIRVIVYHQKETITEHTDGTTSTLVEKNIYELLNDVVICHRRSAPETPKEIRAQLTLHESYCAAPPLLPNSATKAQENDIESLNSNDIYDECCCKFTAPEATVFESIMEEAIDMAAEMDLFKDEEVFGVSQSHLFRPYIDPDEYTPYEEMDSDSEDED